MADLEAARIALDKKIGSLEEELARYALPIFGIRANRLPAVVGSGFLLRIHDRLFIVTASHVLSEGRDTGLWVAAKRGLQQLAMEMYRTKIDQVHGFDFDVAFNVLPDALAEGLLSRYLPVDVPTCDSNHVPSNKHLYVFMGYPGSRTKPNLSTKTVEATILPYRVVMLTRQQFDDLGLNTSVHLAMAFDAPNTRYPDGTTRTPPNPKGISGCGVWSFGTMRQIDHGLSAPTLVGVGIAHCKQPERLEATRMAVVLETIRGIFTELSPYIPKSHYLGVGVEVR